MKNLSFIFMLVIVLFVPKSAVAQQIPPSPSWPCNAFSWKVQPNSTYLGSETINVCPGTTMYVIPDCELGYSVTGLTATGSATVDLSAANAPIAVTFPVSGAQSMTALYETNMIYGPDFDNTGLHRHKLTHTINVNVLSATSAANASPFTLSINNNCPSPLTSVTVNRSYPNNQLWSYEVKLFEVNGTTLTQRWTSGYQNNNNNFTSMLIDNALYNGFTAGTTYQVEVFAKPTYYSGCGPDYSYSRQNFTITPTPVAPKFAFSNTLGSGRNPYTLPLCDPTKDPITVLNQATVPSCTSVLGVDFQMQTANDCNTPNLAGLSSPELAPATTYDLRTIFPQMQLGGYFLVSMRVRTGLGWSVPTAMQCIRVIPSTAGIVNFGFSGSARADGFGTQTCGLSAAQETAPTILGGTCTATDGWLSNGGTPTNATWVGAYFTKIDGLSYNNFTGSVASYEMKIFNQNFPTVSIASLSGTGPITTATNINDFLPYNYFVDAVNTNISAFNGAIFRVEVSAKDVCGKTFSKTGYFRIITSTSGVPTCPKCRTIGGDIFEDISEDNITTASGSFRLSPNPATHILSVSINNDTEKTYYELLTIDGRVLRSETLTSDALNFEVKVNDLAAGTYLLKVITDTKSETQKFIKID